MKTVIATILLATNSGTLPPRVIGLLERQFPDARLELKRAFALYKESPALPTPSCEGAAFYVFDVAGKLTRVGCLDEKFPADGVRSIGAEP